jgi:protoporphyrinogen IX oxidase
MDIFINILFWLHFIGLAMGIGGGIALGFVGPKLIVAEGSMKDEMWGFERFFGRVGSAGLVILIVTGPLVLWLKFGGSEGLTWWFWAKMIFVVIALGGVATHQWAGSRFHRGDRRTIPIMFASGRIAGASMALAVLCAVFAFN